MQIYSYENQDYQHCFLFCQELYRTSSKLERFFLAQINNVQIQDRLTIDLLGNRGIHKDVV